MTPWKDRARDSAAGCCCTHRSCQDGWSDSFVLKRKNSSWFNGPTSMQTAKMRLSYHFLHITMARLCTVRSKFYLAIISPELPLQSVVGYILFRARRPAIRGRLGDRHSSYRGMSRCLSVYLLYTEEEKFVHVTKRVPQASAC